MGGPGSGNRSQLGRRTTESCRSIDVRRWAREGVLKPGSQAVWSWSRKGETIASIRSHAVPGAVNLSYRVQTAGGEYLEYRYPVLVDSTPCRYGGSRAWFRCPADQCGRRVALLYQADNVFACRACCRLAYASSREGHGERAARKADRLRERLGWESGILNEQGLKPKGMRWRTFDRLAMQADVLTQIALRDMARRIGMADDSEAHFPV